MSEPARDRLGAEWASLREDLVEYFADEGGMVILPVVGAYARVGEAFMALLRDAANPALEVQVFTLTPHRLEPLLELSRAERPHLRVTVVVGLETLARPTRRAALAALNRRRQMIRYVQAKLVLWIDPPLVTEIDRYAADLLDWRTRLLELPDQPPDAAPDPASIDVFISYAGPDRAIAEALHAALSADGLRPWSDSIDLLPGEPWDRVVPRALRRARVVVVLITPSWPVAGSQGAAYYGPEEVALAIDRARSAGIPLIPVRLDGAGPARTPYGLHRMTAIESRSSELTPVVEGIRRAVGHFDDRIPPPRDPLERSLQRRDALQAMGAPAEVIASWDARILAIKRGRLHSWRPAAGLLLAARWLLLEQLGRGGFAEVWKAWDETLSVFVAVKLLHSQFDDSAERRARFFRGAHRMAQLDHPQIVRVIEPEAADGGWHFFVMEYMPGGDLEAAVRSGQIPREDALRALVGIAEGLGAAHERGLVHRDVKPSNILLDADSRARLSDFDLVWAADTTGGTRTGALGTFMYAAPEAMEAANTADARADVYGLGMCTLFVLLGQPLPSITVRRPEQVLARVEGFGAVKALVEHAIAWQPASRPADGHAFAEALRAAIEADEGRSAHDLDP